MSLNLQDEKNIKKFLLGDLSEEEARRLRDRRQSDARFDEHMQLVEDELIEDYESGSLSSHERAQFEIHFLTTSGRLRKLMFVRRMHKLAGAAVAPPVPPRPFAWMGWLFAPRWRLAAVAALVVLAGVGAWRVFLHTTPAEEGLLALRAAYREQRPLEARISNLDYAPFPEVRGGETERPDYRARDRAAALIQGAASEKPSVEELHNLGRLYLAQKDFDKALPVLEEALKLSENDARLHSDVGVALFEKGKLERATDQTGRSEATLAKSLEHLNRALQLDDSLLEARFNRALLYTTLKLLPQAAAEWEKYLTQDSRSRWADEARRQLGLIQEQRGKVSRRDPNLFREFMQAYEAGEEEQVWRIFSMSHFRTGNLITNQLLGDYIGANSNGNAGEAEKLSRVLAHLGRLSVQRTDDRFTSDVSDFYRSLAGGRIPDLARARALTKSAHEAYGQSRNDRAIEMYAEAKGLFEQLGDHPEALLTEYWIGHCYFQQPDTPRSLASFTRLSAECEKKGYKWLQAIALNGLANVSFRVTDYSRAVDAGWDAHRISTQIGDDNGALRSLSTLAALQRVLGNHHQALHISRQALDLSARISADASQVIGLYATSALSLSSLGYNVAALEYEKEALNLGEAMGGNPLAMSRYHVQLGLIYGKLRNYDEALRNIRRGLEIGQGLQAEKVGEDITTYALLYLGRMYRQSGLAADALGALDQVARVCRQKDELWLLHEAYKERLLIHIKQGDLALAREELQSVLNSYDYQRQKILEESNRNTFFDKEQDIYDVAIGFAHDSLGDARQSFEYSEMSRARSLYDAATTNWQVQNRAEVPDLRFHGTSSPLMLDALRAQMPDRVQILQYAVLPDKLIIWVVSGDRFESRTVDIGSEELRAKVDRLSALVSRPPAGDEERLLKVSAELYDVLIRPVGPLLDEHKQLCIVADKVLHFVPFGALFSPETRKYLAASFALLHAPSANMFVHDTNLARAKEGVRSERLLSVGNPLFDRAAFPALTDLPSAAREATEITAFYRDAYSLFVGPNAEKGSVMAAIAGSDVLHFATHYVPDASSSMFSKLLLARPTKAVEQGSASGGSLLAHEVYNLKPVRPRLVVLSGCQTGIEELFNGEGAIGLARPFKAAGVPLVVASLWPVDSGATADIMIDFHRLRKRQHVPSVEALREAQVLMLNHPDPNYRHPHYWASFVIIGGYSTF